MSTSLIDFLTFKNFISINVLIVFYYLGAVVLPFGIWYLSRWLTGKYQMVEELQQQVIKKGKDLFWNKLSQQQKLKLLAIFIILFLFMEIFWRMLFEYLIAYIQIRDAVLN